MHITEVIILALGLAADACAAAMTNSLRGMPSRRIFAEAVCFGGMQGLMPVAGSLAGARFYDQIAAFDHVLALVLLGTIGGRMLWECRHPAQADTAEISLRVLFLQGIAVSIDALTVGIGFAAFSDFAVLPVAGIIGAVTAVLTAAGAVIGRKAGAFLHTKAQAAGGLLLIALGIKIFLSHTMQ